VGAAEASAARDHRVTPGRKQEALRRRRLRETRGGCFYCGKRLPGGRGVMDHVVPRAWSGSDDASNLVLSCTECNVRKGQSDAGDFLRTLWRQERIMRLELRARLRAVHAIQRRGEGGVGGSRGLARNCFARRAKRASPKARRCQGTALQGRPGGRRT